MCINFPHTLDWAHKGALCSTGSLNGSVIEALAQEGRGGFYTKPIQIYTERTVWQCVDNR